MPGAGGFFTKFNTKTLLLALRRIYRGIFRHDQWSIGVIDAPIHSLGADREFAFRARNDPGDEYRLVLKSGSLLTMGEHCQERYEHALPLDPACASPRISLSYRPYGWP